MKSITKQKTFEEIEQQLDGFDRVYIAGCGTCATMTKTGGKEEVLAMKEVAVKENNGAIQNAKCILVMACALGVHKLSTYIDKPVIPALDTLFIGVEDSPGCFQEVCAQCGQCVLGQTAGICPLTACHKGLLNGPCGGTDNGKCEVDKEKDCAWTLIYQRLEKQGRLDLMRKHYSPRDYNAVLRPRTTRIT